MKRPTLTVGLPNYGTSLPAGEWHRLLDLARAADAAGIDRISTFDHVVMGSDTSGHVWSRFPLPPDGAWLEPMSVLSACAAVTTHARLTIGILIAPLRSAVLLAKQAATLDNLSSGRLDLGVGSGWQPKEYEASGLDFSKRGQLLTDTIAACKVLWRDSPAAFASPTVNFDDVYCSPKPVQPEGVPVWVAGTLHARSLDRIARHGDGWIPIMGETLQGITEGAARIRSAMSDVGRDPERLRVQATLPIVRDDGGRPDLARSMEGVPDLVAAGADDVLTMTHVFCRDPELAAKCYEEMATRFAQATSSL
jgi:probable F420-dependent oxidoreductase